VVNLYGLLVLRHSRRKLLWLGVTPHPSAKWIARQLTEAYGWSEPPRYISIGFVHVGQDTEIKVDAFNFTRCDGRVLSVSQDAITRDKPLGAKTSHSCRVEHQRAQGPRARMRRASRSTAHRCRARTTCQLPVRDGRDPSRSKPDLARS
jgi:hypothetical protein